MAVVGLNDGGVLALIQAAEQLGRADEVIGWGQDGAFITGDNVNPHLAGSVFYFLEGYAVYAIRDVIDPIAEGKAPPLKADAGDPASRVEPCPVSARAGQGGPGHAGAGEAAARRPGRHHRVRALLPEQVSRSAADVPRPRIGAGTGARAARVLLRRLGHRGRAAGGVAAADRRDRPPPRRTSCRIRRCWRSPSPCRSSACSPSGRRSSAISGGFIDLSQPAA